MNTADERGIEQAIRQEMHSYGCESIKIFSGFDAIDEFHRRRREASFECVYFSASYLDDLLHYCGGHVTVSKRLKRSTIFRVLKRYPALQGGATKIVERFRQTFLGRVIDDGGGDRIHAGFPYPPRCSGREALESLEKAGYKLFALLPRSSARYEFVYDDGLEYPRSVIVIDGTREPCTVRFGAVLGGGEDKERDVLVTFDGYTT